MARISGAERGLIALRLMLGVFFLFEGWDKWPWVTNPGALSAILNRWLETASPSSRWYLQTIAIPGAPVFARLVFFGQVAAGIALILGVRTRLTAIITFLLVINIHLAHSTLFQYSFLSKGDGLPVLGGLLALALGGSGQSVSMRKKKKP